MQMIHINILNNFNSRSNVDKLEMTECVTVPRYTIVIINKN